MSVQDRIVTNPARTLFEICLLRASPADLPASPTLLGLTLAGYLALGVVVLLPGASLGPALLQSLADTLLLVLLLRLVLHWRGLPERFNQSLSALAGTGILLGLLAWPLILSFYTAGDEAFTPLLASLLLLVIFFWTLVVIGHILRHTLAISFPEGMLLGVLYAVLSTSLLSWLFPSGG